jgi:two-component system chemotaxis response regulator CheY
VPKALVVDDSRAMRMIISRAVSEIGYQVQHAGNGREALDVLAREPGPIALALVDWNMPEMNGMELLRSLRADPRYSGMTILMVTTETEMDHMVAALEAGANEYVMKPFTPEILMDKLRLVGACS